MIMEFTIHHRLYQNVFFDLLAAEGADWAEDKVLDPACGGGAFLVTVANRMLGDYRIKELFCNRKNRTYRKASIRYRNRYICSMDYSDFG